MTKKADRHILDKRIDTPSANMFAELNGMKFSDRVAELNGMKFPDRVTYQKSVLMYKILITYSILSSRVLYLHIRYSSEITKIILRHHVK